MRTGISVVIAIWFCIEAVETELRAPARGQAISGWVGAINDMVYQNMMFVTGFIDPANNEILMDEMTGCPEGNPAACPDAGGGGGSSFFSNLSGGTQMCSGPMLLNGRWRNCK